MQFPFYKGKPIYKRLVELVKDGKWDQVYEDKNAAIFYKKK